MARKKTYRTDEFPYHVTARCANQEWFALPLEDCWEIFSNYLWFITQAYSVRVHAFVLMNNHFHLLISTPLANIDEAMNYFLREVSKSIGARAKRKSQIFGGPYHWTVISNFTYYQHAYKYIYRNPVQAGICSRVEDYRYSTIRGLLGLDRALVPAIDNLCLIQNMYKQLSWLNSEFNCEDREAIAKALRRKEFKIPRDPHTGKRSHLEDGVV
ncbi:transposase [Bdellovibrio bacteriovorus]|uniref:transposase n=1 Tax=Bdellovibrio bacteriovorus TaxID=959 RepID=UPI0021D0FF2D|nr:transposase [Bdellovibrio bacteriovorus]UXR65366.1 transposase [Bdellovibrio bacteriovorus]